MLRRLKRTGGKPAAPAATAAPEPDEPIPPDTGPLDHAAYPHILEAVLWHAPHASLLRLRATCRTLRDRVDLAMAAHILHIDGVKHARTPLGTAWRGEHGRHPALPLRSSSSSSLAPPPISQNRIRRLLGRQPPPPPLRPRIPPRQLELLATTRAIDIMHGEIELIGGLSIDLPAAAEHTGRYLPLRAVRTWRDDVRTDAKPTSIPTHTRVAFLWPPPLPLPPDAIPLLGEDVRRTRGRGGTRTVLNISVCDPADPVLWSWIHVAGELVVILVDTDIRPAAGSPLPSNCRAPSDQICRALLDDIVCPYLRTFPHLTAFHTETSITIVNSTALGPLDTFRWRLFFQDFGGEEVLQSAETLEDIVALLTAGRGEGTWPLRFCSLEEYAAEVGEEQFRLETDEGFVYGGI